eukprot:1183189-Prorocentrum_minimum.AAC.6
MGRNAALLAEIGVKRESPWLDSAKSLKAICEEIVVDRTLRRSAALRGLEYRRKALANFAWQQKRAAHYEEEKQFYQSFATRVDALRCTQQVAHNEQTMLQLQGMKVRGLKHTAGTYGMVTGKLRCNSITNNGKTFQNVF